MDKYKKEECKPCKYKHRGGSNGGALIGGLALGGLAGGLIGYGLGRSQEPKTIIVHHDDDHRHQHHHYDEDRYVNHIARYELKVKDTFAEYLDPNELTPEIQSQIMKWYDHQIKNKLYDEYELQWHKDYNLKTYPGEYVDWIVVKMNFSRPLKEFLHNAGEWFEFDGFIADPDPYGYNPIVINGVEYLVIGYLIKV